MKNRLALTATLLSLLLSPAARAEDPSKTYPGYDTTFLDRSVRPQDDFYHFALGGYEKTHPIPADLPSMGIYPQVGEEVRAKLRVILEGLAAHDQTPGSLEQKLGDFYRSGMDTAAVEAAGANPVKPYLARIDAVKDVAGLQAELARLQFEGLDMAFAFSSTPDPKNPLVRVGEAEQGGLGLPSKEYYTDPKRAKILTAYKTHVGRIFTLFGLPAEQAETVLRVETQLAEGSLAPAQLRDPKARFHPMSRAQLAALSPNFNWNAYLDTLGLQRVQSINVATPLFFSKLSDLMASVPLEDWKTYLRWKVMNSTASQLSTAFEDEQFDFSRNLSGATRKPDRWKKLVILADRNLGMALGKKFVEGNFSPAARAKAVKMLTNIRAVLRERIRDGWMSPATKTEAYAKLDKLGIKIGYPDQWKDYSALTIVRGPYFTNYIAVRAFAVQDDWRKIGEPVDKAEWDTSPSTVNAFYDPTKNDICFPAGRLQPPFFDVNADDALNYGATGVTMAHEMSHGFDDEGAQYDSTGALRNWWTPEDLVHFNAKADSVAAQMSLYSYDGQQNNGKLVEGEAIADQAGVGLACEALKRSLKGHPPTKTRDGFTDVQRFFLGYALCRANNQRPEAAHAQMTRDPHPLGMFRVNGPLSNEVNFYRAFDCKPGDKMVRPVDQRINLWDVKEKP